MILDLSFQSLNETFDTSFKEHSQPISSDFNETSQLINSKFNENTELFDTELNENVKYFTSEFSEVYTIVDDGDDTQLYVLVTEDGQELPAVMVEELTMFDATPNDIRIGKVAATENGVTVGEKVIPSYHTSEGISIITSGKPIQIYLPKMDAYDYTKLQAIICDFNKNANNSVSATQVAINDKVYNVLSTVELSEITKDEVGKTVSFGIKNNTNKPLLIRYFTYKEIE